MEESDAQRSEVSPLRVAAETPTSVEQRLRATADGRPLRHEGMRAAPLFRREQVNMQPKRAADPCGFDSAILGRILTVELALRTADAALD